MKDHLGLIELLLVFGSGLAFVIWELISVTRPEKPKAGETAASEDHAAHDPR